MIDPRRLDHEIGEVVIELVEHSRTQYGIWAGYDATSACTRLGLRLAYSNALTKQDGSFDLATRTVIVNRKRTRWKPRRQFTIYHEIMHYLLERDGDLLEYLIERFGEDPEARRAVVESACNLGAAEFLVPRSCTREFLDRFGVSIETIEHLSGVYDASFTVSAIQMTNYAQTPCLAVICRRIPGTRSGTPSSCHIHHASSSKVTDIVVARGTVVLKDHLFHDVWQRGGHVRRETYIPCGSARQSCHGEAKRRGTVVLGVLQWTNVA